MLYIHIHKDNMWTIVIHIVDMWITCNMGVDNYVCPELCTAYPHAT